MSFIDNLRKFFQPTAVVKSPAAPKEEVKKTEEAPKIYGFDQDKENYSDYISRTGSDGALERMHWRSFSVKNNDTGKSDRIDVAYDPDTKQIALVNKYGPKYGKDKNDIKSYSNPEDIAKFFKSNFDRDATRYTVSSAPIDIYDPDEIPQEYHNKATTFFDSDLDGEFIPSAIFDYNNYGARWFGDRDRKLQYADGKDGERDDFIKRLREKRILDNTIKRTKRGTEVNPWLTPGQA